MIDPETAKTLGLYGALAVSAWPVSKYVLKPVLERLVIPLTSATIELFASHNPYHDYAKHEAILERTKSGEDTAVLQKTVSNITKEYKKNRVKDQVIVKGVVEITQINNKRIKKLEDHLSEIKNYISATEEE